jgi:hypothetical protein
MGQTVCGFEVATSAKELIAEPAVRCSPKEERSKEAWFDDLQAQTPEEFPGSEADR